MKRFTWEDQLASDLQQELITKHDMPGWLWRTEAREAILRAFRDYHKEKLSRRRLGSKFF